MNVIERIAKAYFAGKLLELASKEEKLLAEIRGKTMSITQTIKAISELDYDDESCILFYIKVGDLKAIVARLKAVEAALTFYGVEVFDNGDYQFKPSVMERWHKIQAEREALADWRERCRNYIEPVEAEKTHE